MDSGRPALSLRILGTERLSREGSSLSISHHKNKVGLNRGIRYEHGPRLTSAWWLLIVFVDKVAHDALASSFQTVAAQLYTYTTVKLRNGA